MGTSSSGSLTVIAGKINVEVKNSGRSNPFRKRDESNPSAARLLGNNSSRLSSITNETSSDIGPD